MQPQLQAEQRLLQIEAAAVPSMDPHKRAGLIQSLIARATGKRPKSAAEALMGAGIPIRHVPKTTGRAGTRRKGKHG